MFELILDREAIDSGATQAELNERAMLAQIEAALIRSGRAIRDIYAEWETSTPEAIIERYASLLCCSLPPGNDSAATVTDWMDVKFRCMAEPTEHGCACAIFAVDQAGTESSLSGSVKIQVSAELEGIVAALHPGELVKIRVDVGLEGSEISAFLMDVLRLDPHCA